MASIDPIQAALGKGMAITARDVRDIEIALALMPLEEAHEVEPWAWEGVALIVNDLAYTGDATLPKIN